MSKEKTILSFILPNIQDKLFTDNAQKFGKETRLILYLMYSPTCIKEAPKAKWLLDTGTAILFFIIENSITGLLA